MLGPPCHGLSAGGGPGGAAAGGPAGGFGRGRFGARRTPGVLRLLIWLQVPSPRTGIGYARNTKRPIYRPPVAGTRPPRWHATKGLLTSRQPAAAPPGAPAGRPGAAAGAATAAGEGL